MDKSTNALNWFEIPASDISRAKNFYENVFDVQMDQQSMMGMEMAFFPAENGNGKVSGAVVQSDMHKPSGDGAVLYLNANPSMDTILSKVEAAGGQIVMPKTEISPEIGNMAFFTDTEGNKIGLHSQN